MQQSKALDRNAWGITTDPDLIQAVTQPATTGKPMGRRTIGPDSSGLREGLASRDVLVPSHSSDCCGEPGACMLTRSPGVWCFIWHIGVAGFRVKCVKKQCGLAGFCFRVRMALDLHLSRICTGVAAMGQDCNYQLDITKLGVKVN
jgi:hypothetical protein